MTLICWLCLDKRTEGPVVTVQSRKHLYLLYLLPFHHRYNPIRLGVRTPHPPFFPFIFSPTLSFKPTKRPGPDHKAANNQTVGYETSYDRDKRAKESGRCY